MFLEKYFFADSTKGRHVEAILVKAQLNLLHLMSSLLQYFSCVQRYRLREWGKMYVRRRRKRKQEIQIMYMQARLCRRILRN